MTSTFSAHGTEAKASSQTENRASHGALTGALSSASTCAQHRSYRCDASTSIDAAVANQELAFFAFFADIDLCCSALLLCNLSCLPGTIAARVATRMVGFAASDRCHN